MKLNIKRILPYIFAAVSIFTALSKDVKGTVRDTIFFADYQAYDTVTICNDFDSIMVIPPADMNFLFWFLWGTDTLYVDTLIISGQASGQLDCQGDHGTKLLFIQPLTLYGNDMYLSCTESKKAQLFTNLSAYDAVNYSWSPEVGLSDPHIIDPIISGQENRHYTVTMQTSKGCQVTTDINITLKRMQSPEICIASVDTSNKNILYWSKPAWEGIDSFFIYREKNVTNQYEKIGSVGYYNYGFFRDSTSYPEIHSNKYKLSMMDVCGQESEFSAPHKTMHLSVSSGLNDSWNLIWEPYEGFGVSTYNIYRGVNNENLELIGTTSGSSTQFSDLEPPDEDVYYQVEVISPNSCDINLPEALKSYMHKKMLVNSTKSNIVHEALVPTAINNISNNSSIYPNPTSGQLFIEIPEAYTSGSTVEIYNMDGQLQFKTNLDATHKEIQIDALEVGNYILRINSPEGSRNYKIIKK